MALIGMSAAGKAIDDAARQRLAEAIATDSEIVRERYRDGSALAFEMTAIVATASG
jgi:hypothetical protein